MASVGGNSAEQAAAPEKDLTQLFSELEKGDINAKKPPTVKFLEWLHRNASTTRDVDIHHRVGQNEGDVAAGKHNHDGKNSPFLFAAADIPADPAATLPALQAWAIQINDLLQTKAG